MKSLAIDPDDLLFALSSGAPYQEPLWYLDRETGAVLLDHEDSDDLSEDFGDDPRYLYIEPFESSRSYEVMQDFVESVPESRAAEALQRALDGRKPFRHFKDALLDYPDLREQWFQYEREAQLRMAMRWLDDHDIEPVWRRTGHPE